MLSPSDQERIAQAVAAVEARTSGEIVCTLSTEKHRYVEWVLGLAVVISFLVPFALTLAGFGPSFFAHLMGQWQTQALPDVLTIEIYAAMQAVTLVVATGLLWWSPLAQRYAPLSMRQERVHELALKQFLSRGIHLTNQRTGILFHVSLEDHVVEVIADEAIYTIVPNDHWGEEANALLRGIKNGDLAQGFIDAIELAGAVLAEHFPPTDENPDELPNYVVIV